MNAKLKTVKLVQSATATKFQSVLSTSSLTCRTSAAIARQQQLPLSLLIENLDFCAKFDTRLAG